MAKDILPEGRQRLLDRDFLTPTLKFVLPIRGHPVFLADSIKNVQNDHRQAYTLSRRMDKLYGVWPDAPARL